MSRCNLPPALLAEWPGSFTCHCGNTGAEQTPNKSQHRKLTLEKKIFPPLRRGSNTQPFDDESGALTNKLSRLPGKGGWGWGGSGEGLGGTSQLVTGC